MFAPQDLLARPLQPLLDRLFGALIAGGWSAAAAQAAADLAALAALALFVLAAVRLGAALRGALRPLAAVGAGALLLWLVAQPSPHLHVLVGRADHLLFCAFAGAALYGAAPAARAWAIALVSLLFLARTQSGPALAVVAAGSAAGYTLLRLDRTAGTARTVLGQGAVLAATFAGCWALRGANLLVALEAQGLFAFMLLRHVSFAIDARRGQPAPPSHYLCYMAFYPPCIGASELYGEFCRRNLAAETHYRYAAAARTLVVAFAQVWLVRRINVSFDAVLAAPTTAAMWSGIALLYFRAALFAMALWSVIDAVALLYGVALRPNFARIFRAENPAQFWHCWRGTMTNWLVQYVYIPLGGNRRAQHRNIFAAFAVSTAWHCMGVAFMGPAVPAATFVPFVLWGLLNAAAVSGHALGRKRGLRMLPEATPPVLRHAIRLLLTAALATFTVTLLDFTPQRVDRLPHFLRTLIGLG
jgi:hypothetical protein